MRQRLEQHRSAPACMQCHSKIDPWGVALEQFDAGGLLKHTAVDASSTLPDQTDVHGHRRSEDAISPKTASTRWHSAS